MERHDIQIATARLLGYSAMSYKLAYSEKMLLNILCPDGRIIPVYVTFPEKADLSHPTVLSDIHKMFGIQL